MKELTSSFMQLLAMILIMITLAISTAALSQWADTDNIATRTKEPAPVLAAQH